MNISVDDLREVVARRMGINAAEIQPESTLRDILGLSRTAINSIDVMEAFLGGLVELGATTELDLPAITLDDKVTDVLSVLVACAAKQ
jgi:hypothetical protein